MQSFCLRFLFNSFPCHFHFSTERSSFHISVLVVSGGTRRFTDLKSVEVLSEGRPLCRLPRLDRTRVQHSQAGLLCISTSLYLSIYSQAGLLVCGNWDSRAEETCSSLSDGGRDTDGISRCAAWVLQMIIMVDVTMWRVYVRSHKYPYAGVWTRSHVLIQDRFAHMTSHDLNDLTMTGMTTAAGCPRQDTCCWVGEAMGQRTRLSWSL